MNSLRALLRINLQRELAKIKGPVAISLSAGTDSCCMLFELLSLGVKPHCYCYKLKGKHSEDYERAAFLANKHGLTLTCAEIPFDKSILL